MNKTVVSIKNLYFKNIFHNFSLNIPADMNFAIVGENGIGKTTLIKILCNLLSKDSGTITFSNNIKHHHANSDISYCAQHSSLPPNIKVKNILQLFARIHHITWEHVMTHSLFHNLRIDTILNVKSQHLSGGQNRRLILFLTLFYNPRIVFLDEPFNDIDDRKNMIAILKTYCLLNHIQIILISHSVYEIKQLTQAGIFLSANKKNIKIYSSKQLNNLLIKTFKN